MLVFIFSCLKVFSFSSAHVSSFQGSQSSNSLLFETNLG